MIGPHKVSHILIGDTPETVRFSSLPGNILAIHRIGTCVGYLKHSTGKSDYILSASQDAVDLNINKIKIYGVNLVRAKWQMEWHSCRIGVQGCNETQKSFWMVVTLCH